MPLNGSTNLGKTRDFWPTKIRVTRGSQRSFNVATVRNSQLNISSTYPVSGSSGYPASPVHMLFEEASATTEHMCGFFAKQFVKQQKQGERYAINGRPERFDIYPGEVMQFYAYDGAAITDNHQIFAVDWWWSPKSVGMSLTVGRDPPSLIGSLRYAVQSSQ